MAFGRKFFLIALIILSSCVSACAPVSTPLPAAPDINQLNTAIALTAQAAIVRTQQAASPTSANSPTFTSTFTPTFTPTASPTGTLFFTATSEVPKITVSIATNCRSGPGKVYEYKGALKIGEVADVLAKDPTSKYWFIPNPEAPGQFCWVWGEYATITGNTVAVPVFTPPPTPTASNTPLPSSTAAPGAGVKLNYTSMDTCTGNWWVEFTVKNNGNVDLKSINVEVFDSDTHVGLSNFTDGFRDRDGCGTTHTRDVLPVGSVTTVSAPAFAYNPAGHEIEIRVLVCSETGQTGICIQSKIEFIP
jgi:hypothetical protein